MTVELVKSGDVQGKHLVGLKNAKLGTVRETYFDLRSGTVEFLVVEATNLLGGSGKFQPVPWCAVRYDGIAGTFRVELGKDEFKAAPSYDRDQLANPNYGWSEQVTRYFSATATPLGAASSVV